MSDTPKRRLLDRSSNSTTIVSEGTTFEGVLSGKGDFLISGRVNGNCDVGGSVTLTPEGSWDGTIRAANVIVRGTVEGDIVAEQRIELGRGARVTGTVTASEIAVAEGAIVDGEMHTTAKDGPITFSAKRASDPSP